MTHVDVAVGHGLEQALKILGALETSPRFHSPLVAGAAARQLARGAGGLPQKKVQVVLSGVGLMNFLMHRFF
jgi:hypothetical protein